MVSFQLCTDPYGILEKMPSLNILDYDKEKLRQVAESGGVLYWNYGGLWRKIPNAVIVNTLSIIDDWDKFRDRHANADIPKDISLIKWDQTTPTQDLKSASQAPVLRPHQL